MEAEPEQFHPVFAVEPACRVVVANRRGSWRSGLSRVGQCVPRSRPMTQPVPTHVQRCSLPDGFSVPGGFPRFSVSRPARKISPIQRTDRLLGPVSAASQEPQTREGKWQRRPRRAIPAGSSSGVMSFPPLPERPALEAEPANAADLTPRRDPEAGRCGQSDCQGNAVRILPPGWPPAPAGWVAPPGWQLASLLYVGFILIGILNGVPQQDPFGYDDHCEVLPGYRHHSPQPLAAEPLSSRPSCRLPPQRLTASHMQEKEREVRRSHGGLRHQSRRRCEPFRSLRP